MLSKPATGIADSGRQVFPTRLLLWTLLVVGLVFPGLLRASCGSPGNAIEAENCLTGTPQSTWDVGTPPTNGTGDPTIQGFGDNISVNVGQTINFKINTNANSYHLDIYRMGYYQGNGARLVTSITPSATLPQTQPACLTGATTGLYDCGNWAVSASWAVPSTAVSGIYFARVVRDDTLGASHIVFIVRNDAGHSNILFQASDTSWQAYNDYGGQNLYGCSGGFNLSCRAYKVSYNRPFHTRDFQQESVTWVFGNEYPMVRWLEANGYDVTYFTDTDTDRNGSLILNHKLWMSNGHDEYWSANQRANIQAARSAGVHLAFFSGNTMFWKTRWENSIDGTNTSYRTLVCYKETVGDVTDPLDPPTWTGTWRDPTKSPPADGGQPENAVKGNIFRMNGGQAATMQVPQADGQMRFWRNTIVASLPSGQTASLAPGTVGAEFDDDEDNGYRPAGLFELTATSVYDPGNYLLDYGVTYGAGTAINKVVMYKAPSGALVFSTGTYRWSWGLDNNHDDSNLGSTTDPSMQQATVNLFADMGVQPATLQAPLAPASASSDTTPPTSTITSPTPGASLQPGAPITVQGTALDAGGGVVAGVEVSTDGGATWHPANGRASWSYTGAIAGSGSVTIRSRAVDDSGNLETPSAGVTVNVPGQSCPCTIWPSSAAPASGDPGPDSSVELGVKFQTDFNGTITGIRFYKFAANTGTHVGNLWSSSGTLLASGTFTNESGSGWQEVDFTTPVAVTANTVYIASYHTGVGHYALDSGYFASAGFDNPPLHALENGVSGGNGVFGYGTGNVFPSGTFNSANYWVDVVYTSTSAVRLTSITVAPSQATLQAGGTQQFTATGTYIDSSTQNITTQVTWSSSNTTAAAINSSGLATALSGGSLTITASGGSISGSALLTIQGTPLVITTTSLPAASQNSPYSFQIAASGGVLPYTWTLLSGTLPAGLSLASNGQITGTPTTQQTTTFTAQVTDSGAKDSINPQQTATQALSLTINPPPAFFTIWPPTAMPGTPDSGDPSAVEVGVKFRADLNGTINGIRFYKSSSNIGTHVGHLWSASGTLLGSGTFTNETASGWQEMDFATPVNVTANTVYVASYSTQAGHYSADVDYFASSGLDNPPLHALLNGASGANGVFNGSPGAFPNSSFSAGNYWVDVVFFPAGPDTNTPTVQSVSPGISSSGADPKGAISATFSEPMDPTTINSSTFFLLDPSSAVVPVTVTYNTDTNTATLTPSSPLLNATTYSAVLKGGSTDPRVKDLAENALASNFQWTFTTGVSSSGLPTSGPGGPILVVSSSSNPFSQYYAEILRAEGLNEFAVQDISQVSGTTLASYDVVLLGDMSLTSDQVTIFTNWVSGGGNLIAMHPDKQLAGLLGLSDASAILPNAYLLMNTTAGPGAGLVGQTIQFHGNADLYALNGAISFADLYSNASTPSGNPAVTANPVGTGIAAAFTYDLARSIVYQRQGNPAWSAQARSGLTPMRSDDLFFGNAAFDPEPDWVDFNKIQIPQADEQQRLLANLILQMNSIKRPLPRFWYLPRGLQAAVVLTGDDHGAFFSGGATAPRFDQYAAASAPGCNVANWECVRASSYLFPPVLAANPLTDAQAAGYLAQGFEVAAHMDTSPDCTDWSSMSALDSAYTAEMSSFGAAYPSIPAPQTHRLHCVAWSDYDSQPQVELNHGIRLDTTYYYYPSTWILDRPGLFTGSAMPMRFTDRNGNLIDVYQATTQLTDESGQTYPYEVNTLLDNALNLGYYGAFVANMHNDTADPTDVSSVDTAAILASAQARGVPIISAVQLLKWLDGRNGSSFSLQSWDGATLTFNILVGANAQGLQAMLPASFSGTPLNSLTLNGSAVSYTLQTIKGMQYAVFAASSNGTYSAQYSAVTSVTVNPTSVVGGDPSTGTVTINSPALSGGVVVALQSDNPAATIPATVTIAQGQNSAPFNISTSHVLSSTPVHITGSFNSTSQPATLTLTTQLTPTTAVTVTAGGNPSTYGSSATFMATVSGSGLAPTGSVSFYDGGTCSTPGATLGISVALNGSAQASVTTSALTAAASPHTILACYSGDVTYTTGAGTLAQAVNLATVTPNITVSSKVYDGTTAATITARSLSGVVGSDDVTLSGGTAAFASKNVGTAETVTATGLTLSGTTAANYQLSSTPATTTANITAAAVTVTADTQSKVYGNLDPALTYKLTSGSLATGDSFTGGLTRVSGANVGTYAIQQGTLALSSNYFLTYVGANLTITAAPLTVTAANASRSYGVANPAFTGTLTGVQNNDNITATYSSAATISSPVGTYAIVPALVDPGNKLGNYSVTANNGVLTVTALTVTAVSVNPAAVAGGAGATGTVTLSGIAPGGGAVVVLQSGTPSVATVPANVTVPAGQNSATFAVTTSVATTAANVTITATFSGSVQTTLTVNLSLLVHNDWSLLSVDSQETICGNGVGTNAFDGNPSTMWHTQFCPTAAPMPHQISINLGASYRLVGFQYLPRQDGSACGWIKQYAFYVSTDGVNWGTAVATGTFKYGNLSTNCPGPGAGVPSAIQVTFSRKTAQYIRLVALSELHGNPWTSVAELNVLGTASPNDPPPSLAQVTVNPAIVVGGGTSAQGTVTLSGPAPAGGVVVNLASSDPSTTVPTTVTVPANALSATFTITTTAVGTVTQLNISGSYSGNAAQASFTVNPGSLISQTDWSLLSVDSQETICGNGVGTNAFDGNPSTMWHTQLCPTAAPMPHQISINLGASYNLTAFQYLPRQDGSACGWIKDYAFYVSSDGVNWGTAVATGTFNYGNLSTNCPGPGASVPSALQIAFPQTTGQYIRLVALDELHGNPWTSAAEINVLGALVAGQSTALTSVSLNPAIVVGGSSSTGTVTLSTPAPAGGAVVSLSSGNTAVATVPASVTVPASAISATFTITTTAVGAPTQLNISGSYSGNAQASFTVNPGSLILQTGWSLLSVDSQETICGNGVGTNAFDGNPSTMWHTQFCPSSAPMPHQISINLGASYTLTAFQYLPRQDGSACGWIKDYAFYVSSDGVNWGTAVATGTFNYGNLSTNCPGPGASVPSALQIAFPPTTGQYIRLVALDELHGNPWTSVAELNVLGTVSGSAPPPTLAQVTVNPAIVVGGTSAKGTVSLSGPAPAAGAVVSLASSDPSTTVPLTVTVPANAVSANFTITTTAVGTVTQLNISGSYNGNAQTGFTVNSGTLISQAGWSLLYADSQETTCYNGAATNAFDGNPATAWSTPFCTTAPPGPHEIQINLGASHTLTAFRYLAQQDGSSCGWIQQYEFYVSSDGLAWGTPVATGSFDYTGLTQACLGPGASLPPAQQVAFPAVTAQYIRFREITGFEGTPVAAVAELNVLGQ